MPTAEVLIPVEKFSHLFLLGGVCFPRALPGSGVSEQSGGCP